MNPDTALVTVNGETLPVRPTMIRPIATADEALENWRAFQELKGKLITADDLQAIAGKSFIKKAGWRKIAAAFGISLERTHEERDEKNGRWVWRLTARATAPNGRFAEGTAACASDERRFAHPEHDSYAMAYTRAANRAISDLVGGGEVSAEEMRPEPKPALSREQAAELLTQFDHSCDTQHVNYDYRTLCVHLLQSADDLRRAFKYFKDQGSIWADDARVEDPEEADDRGAEDGERMTRASLGDE